MQSEIHMSEEAIQDILEQTESDPAFQALFDLFDYGKWADFFKTFTRNVSSSLFSNSSRVKQHYPEHWK